jgi:type IV pilus secretin PilQ/predicted competence protein
MAVSRRLNGPGVGYGATLIMALVAGTASTVALAQSAPTTGAPAGTRTTPMPTAPSSVPSPAAENQAEPQFPEDVEPYEADPAPAPAAGPESAEGAPGAKQPTEGMSSGVKVSEYMTVDLFVQDEDLANVLQMLSLQSQRNIVASRDVSARVTANLYGVTFYEALDAILHVNGYGYIEKGNFIYIYTAAELAKIQAEQRAIVSKVLRLNYLNANDAAEFVAPLLSDKGSIKTNGDVGEFNIPQDTPTGAEEFALSATLVVFDYPEHVSEIEALLSQIDTRPQQVLVEATILQTALTEANAFGVDFAFLSDMNFTDFFGFGGPLSTVNNLIKGDVAPANNQAQSVVSNPGNTNGPATMKIGIISDDFSVFVRMLDEVSDTTILSNPKILALNRQPARVLVGRKIGYLNTTSTDTATTQTVEFLDTGTQLAFRPFISKDGMIRLELKPRVSEGVIRNATDATGAAVTIPDEITQEITTNVIVPDGSTVVLGGLFKETTDLTRRQVPVLGDIPLIGAAFRGHDDETDRSEIIFMVKPTIVNDQILIEQGERSLAFAERVRTGTRQGLLPWSRDRQTAQLNMEAGRLAEKGETDQATWALRRSLELNPDQPGAIQQLEVLTGKREWWPSRSVLERVINGEAYDKGYYSENSDPSNHDGEGSGSNMASGSGAHMKPAAFNGAAYSDPQFSNLKAGWAYGVGDPLFVASTLAPMPFDWLWTMVAWNQLNMAFQSYVQGDLPGTMPQSTVTDANPSNESAD